MSDELVNRNGMFNMVLFPERSKYQEMYREQREEENLPSDLTDLEDLTNENILEVVKKRYENDEIYTSGGGHDILLSVNPFKELSIYTDEYHRKYSWETLNAKDDPHIFAVTTKAYKRLRETGGNQVVLVTGESGSGKTENTKLMVKHLISMCGSNSNDLEKEIIEVNPLLEAFGNAKTVLNNNSSRFAKYLEIKLDDEFKITDATIKDYMLEKSRVVSQSEGECNFHIFYSFLAGLNEREKENFKLGSNNFRIAPKPFPKRKEELVRDFRQQIDVMEMIGLSEEEITNVKIILSSILHITNIKFTTAKNDAVEVKDERPLVFAASLLEIDLQQFAKFLVIRKISVSGEDIDCLNSKDKANEMRDAVAKFLYERLFGWLVRQINVSLNKTKSWSRGGTIGILDICGFESLEHNGLEQLCINIVNEKFQMFMNTQMFRREKQIYRSEDLDWTCPDYTSNQEIVDMFFKDRTGILCLIDEDTKFQQATDDSLVQKLDDQFGGNEHYHKTKGANPEFYITHFAGAVKYNAAGFLEKNGNELSEQIIRCLQESGNEMVSDLFTVRPTNTGTISGTQFMYRMSTRHNPVCPKPTTNKITAGLVRDTFKILKDRYGGNAPGGEQAVIETQNQKTVITYFRNSMQELLKKMETAEARFVRCVKPNENQAPDSFDEEKVLQQLRYNGIAEVAQIRKLGYPVRLRYSDFFERYELLEPTCRTRPKNSDAAEMILAVIGVEPWTFQLGREQVFLKEEVSDKLKKAKEAEMERIQKIKEKEEEKKRQEEEIKQKETEQRASILKIELNHALDTITEVATPASSILGNKIDPDLNLYTDSSSGFGSGSQQNPSSSGFGSVSQQNPSSSGFGSGSQQNPSSSGFGSGSQQNPSSSGFGSGSQQNASSTNGDYDDPSPSEPQKRSTEKSEKDKTAFWDIFRIVDRELPVKDVHEQLPMKVLKLVFYFFFFIILLGACVFHKISLMVLLPSLKNEKQQNNAKYLLTVVVVVVPYALTSATSFLKWLFGGTKIPSLSTCTLVFVMESLHTVGMCLLIFRILPDVDQFTGIALISAVAFLPALLRLVSCRDVILDLSPEVSMRGRLSCSLTLRRFCGSKFGRVARNVLDVVNVAVQLSVLPAVVVWDFLDNRDWVTVATVTTAFVLVSFGWWENFVDDRFFCKIRLEGPGTFILKARYELQEGRSGLFMLSHLWKIILTTLLAYAFKRDNLTFSLSKTMDSLTAAGKDLGTIAPVFGLVFSSMVAYYVGYVACKLRMQIVSFSVPLILTTPIAYCVFLLNTKYDIMLSYLMPDSSPSYPDISTKWPHLVCGFVWWLSLLWVTRYIWFPRQENLAKFERLFTNPMYCGILTTENLLLNRRRDKRKVLMRQHEDYQLNIISTYELQSKEQQVEGHDPEQPMTSDVPRIYACATMWHENRVEMVQLLKSLHRLDADQWNRKQAMIISGIDDPNFYEYEAHIFFDDAMEVDDDDKWRANSYVKMLISLVQEACSCVHNRPMSVHSPYRVITPYGAQLVWQMPGENLLYVHIKDKNKIRHRKRWSQVMYMYYLLGYRLTKESEDELLIAIKNNELEKKSRLAIFERLSTDVLSKAENTFILALDGDTDFMPGAVRLLVDRMRKGERVGAACGRIHPIGTGPLVWYQKFEYAIGHWLQKSTEHVLGCVLCSPGCFSLFRGSALIDDNIIRKYAILPTEPGHYLQYEQGEDRWLCTLLLQQGYRVDYVAGADAYTYAPEGFNEFFNQRRRWMPSTLANIMDLLSSAQITVAMNPNISNFYIWYQMAIMLGTVLGPGTVTLMIAGSIQKVFELPLITCYVIAVVPPTVYIVACYHLKPKYQLIFAAILSTAYSFLMMVVLVGTFVTASENPFHPSVIFFVGLIGIFLFTGLLHIKELACLLHGLLYMVSLPAGYLVLVIYSMCNLFNVSWGTREAPKRKTQAELQQVKAEKEKKKDGFFARLFLRSSYLKEVKELLQSVGRREDISSESRIVESLKELNRNFVFYATHGNEPQLAIDPQEIAVDVEETVADEAQEDEMHQTPAPESTDAAKSESPQPPPERPAVVAPPSDEWLHDRDLGNGPLLMVNADENVFWNIFIDKYLKPLEKDEQKEIEIKAGLFDLRDNYVFMFVMSNLLWIALNYMFQEKKPVSIPFLGQDVELLGLLFVFFFLIILLIQFGGMLVHRWGTLQHMISVTDVTFFRRNLGLPSDTIQLADALKFCQEFNHEPIPDYEVDDEDERTPAVLHTAVVQGKSVHIKADLNRSVRETILAKGMSLSATNAGKSLMQSMKHGIPMYLQGSTLARGKDDVEGSAVSFVRNLRQSLAAGNIKRQDTKRLPSALRRRNLHDAASHVIKRAKQTVHFKLEEDEEESENVYESLDEFGHGTMGRSFAKKMKHFKKSLPPRTNGYYGGIDV